MAVERLQPDEVDQLIRQYPGEYKNRFTKAVWTLALVDKPDLDQMDMLTAVLRELVGHIERLSQPTAVVTPVTVEMREMLAEMANEQESGRHAVYPAVQFSTCTLTEQGYP